MINNFDYAFELVKQEVERALSSAPSIIRKYMLYLNKSSGKFVRGKALIACAEKNDKKIPSNAVQLAAAVEILHLATLVHDDVIDNAGKRRGSTTLQKKFGKKTAVICGDYLFCVALRLAGEVSDKEKYLNLNIPDYMSRICAGELNQHINNGNFDLSVLNYMRIISGKTAALFEATFYAGAVLSEVGESDVKKYMRLGRYMGIVFQLSDDCNDFETSENVAKKPVQSDYEQGVITLPLIYAFKSLREFKEKAKTKILCRDEINHAVSQSGGIKYTRMVSKKYYDKALTLINELNITDEKRLRLKAILDKI